MINKDIHYVNYHRHDKRCNIATGADSCLNTQDYIDRAKELGHTALSSCNHGYPSSQFDVYDSCFDKKGDKVFSYVFAVEGYFVLDTSQKDRTNAHIIYIAKNNEGRREINRLISDIAKDDNGLYYGRPRTNFDRILELNPDNVMITTACMFGVWKYPMADDLVLALHNHFKDSLYLEYQSHNSKGQIEINERIKNLSCEYGINTIIGCDTHVIYEEEKGGRPNGIKNREAILRSRKTENEEEDWFMDYPSSQQIFDRFEQQGVLTEEDVFEALNNTNIMLKFEISIDKSRKMPTLYNELTQSEINDKYTALIWELWEERKLKVPQEYWKEHIEELKEETRIITESNTSDYFLLNYEIIKLGNKNGGMLTPTGRGSAVSWLSNWVLGFTKLNRILNPVTMYKERFITLTRAKKQLPDIDFNLADPMPYANAQDELMGKSHSYPMIAFGTLREKSAFKMLARSENIPPEISNEISKGLSKWEEKIKYNKIEDEDGNEINDPSIKVEEFIGEEYLDIYKRSEKYMGIIDNLKQSPCSWVLYTQGDIEDEISLIRIKGKKDKPDSICANIEGGVAERYGYVKNDLLTVKVVPLMLKSWERAGLNIPEANELYNLCEGDKKTWDIYAKGLTLGINQYEKSSTAQKSMKYRATNIVESSLFIGAIRPGFRSNITKFLNREEFNYGVSVFDKLIQTKEMPYTYLLFQEFLMKAFNFAGVPLDRTVDVVKAISKKKIETIEAEKVQFYNGFTHRIMEEDGKSKEEAISIVDKIWKIVYDSGAYLFNSSHSVSVGTDSLYCARIKAHHPLCFYETMLRLEKDKNKISLIKAEMPKLGVNVGELSFGLDNTDFMLDYETNSVNQSLKTVKFLNDRVSLELKELGGKEFLSFLDLYNEIKNNTTITSKQMMILIKIGYFKKFGSIKKMMSIIKIMEEFKLKKIKKTNLDSKWVDILTKGTEVNDEIKVKSIKKYTQITPFMEYISETPKSIKVSVTIKRHEICSESNGIFYDINKDKLFSLIWESLDNSEIEFGEKVEYELEYLGYVMSEIPRDISVAVVENVSIKNKSANLKSFRNNPAKWFRFKKDEAVLPEKGDVLIFRTKDTYVKSGYKGRKDTYIKKYKKIG